jgi:nascent polypeptide-associated complex subunit beta
LPSPTRACEKKDDDDEDDDDIPELVAGENFESKAEVE